MKYHIRILHVDDDPDLTEVVSTFLDRENERFEVETVNRPVDGLDRLSSSDIDCVVSDYDMPGQNGLEFLKTIRELYPDLPFILYTGKGSEEIASDAISSGVTDYLQKTGGTDQYTILANRILNAVEAHRAKTNLERRSRQAEALATLSREALEGRELPSLFDRAVDLVSDRLGTEYAKILELTPHEETLQMVAGAGWDERVVETATVGTARESQAGYTLSVSEPVVVEDLRTEDRFQPPHLLTDHDIVSGISAVIGSLDDPWGVFETHTTVRRSFTSDDVRFVQNVANVLATTIERDRTEQHRRESERRFREIAELSPDTIFRLDTEGEFTYVSPAIESLLGYTPADLLATNFQQYVVDESLPGAVEGFSRVCDGEVVRDLAVTLIAADGTLIDVELSASPVRDGSDVTHVQGFARDITDRKARERNLQTLKAQYETLVEHIPDMGVFLFDEDCRYKVAGGDELSAVGLTSADFEGATPHELFPDHLADELTYYYEEALSGTENTFEQEYQGSYYQIQTVPVRNTAGEVVSGLAVSQNITDRKQRQAELERHNETLEEFASVVSHDLRGPLHVAQGRLELVREECESEHLDRIATALERSQALIADVLTLTLNGDQIDQVESIPLAEAARRAWENVPTAAGTVEIETDQTVLADRSRLEQVLENLIRNAIDHGGPEVTVTIGSLSAGFFVEDSGSGIPREERERIFEAGYSTGNGGTGFGLRIVKQIVEAHGWEITVTDGTEGGARFEITKVQGESPRR